MAEDVVKKRYWFASIVFLAAFLAVPVVGFFITDGIAERGQWGDFFGGSLNPLLTFLTFVGLLYTIFLQQRELSLSREELSLTREELKRSSDALESQNESLAQQRFENTLFSMIGVLNQIIEKMDTQHESYEGISKSYNGRDCFTYFQNSISNIYRHRSWNDEPNYEEEAGDIYGDRRRVIEYPHDLQRCSDAYEHFFKRGRSDLAHYFRVLYNILRYIDSSQFKDDIYPKIVRAQLSDQELFVIFYNCLSPVGRNFCRYTSKFHLFDNLNVADLLHADHVSFAPEGSFGPEERETRLSS